MIETFVIVIAFTDWDACFNWAHKHEVTNAQEVCIEIVQPMQSSLRPKIRPKDLTNDRY
jgi:hypothetical protein